MLRAKAVEESTVRQPFDEFTADVGSLVAAGIGRAVGFTDQKVDVASLLPGKMLRTRLAGRLARRGRSDVSDTTLRNGCAAVEMVHTASLCHDDVIDSGLTRRGFPTLWKTTSPSGAVLIGDVLLCEALTLLVEQDGGRHLPVFIERVREVIQAEAEQELLWRGKTVSPATCMRLARGKTGPLFAFAARISAGENDPLAGILEKVGYDIGTAYQLADDLLDIAGREETAGKTLGTDRARGKLTLPEVSDGGRRDTRGLIVELCRSALAHLADYPSFQSGLDEFLSRDLQPVLERNLNWRMSLSHAY